MAEVLLTMAVGPLLSMVKEKASSYLLDEYKVMEGMEQQHEVLKRKLPAILDVITDAEELAAKKHREGVKAWLEAVRKVAYKANDVLDEFKYEALRRQAKAKGHYKALGMDVIKLFPTHNRVVFRYKMAKRLCMILQEIDMLITEMNAFRFEFKPQPPMPKQWRQEDSCIPKDCVKIAGKSRAKEKKDLIDNLFARASSVDLTVLPIIGMGGLGKTTLARLVYNDSEIQEHFELRLWVCVSDDFDVDSLADKIVKENGCATYGSSALDRLQNAVSGKRYLLVLDDVWNRDELSKWQKLKSYLQHGGSGSSVLTTTRDEAVAKLMMGTTEGSYKLGSLGADFIEEIIKTRAFSSKKEEERPRDLVDMVGEVAKRCVGSPLAATALGSLLGTKTTKDEWKSVLSRSSICDEENNILPVLKLSYNGLPSHMRQCFAFCAMFPKDYVIDVEMLIQLWMSNDFIPEKQGERPEISGKNIFMELSSRSFFQDVKGIPFQFSDTKVSRITCKIHDLMHDVAQSAMGEECAAIATRLGKSEDIIHSARHLYLSVWQSETLLNASLEKGCPAFQTLIFDGNVNEDVKILSKKNSIRALKIDRGSVLRPKYLHHLRYLDLSESNIQSLPEDISILYHLQTLNLSYCHNLERLPMQLKYLTALRHLYTHGCRKLKSMPPVLGHLTSLQMLTCFVAGTDSGCSNVGELQNLDLGGKLELRQLENVTREDAQGACLGEKKNLTELELRWTDYVKEAQNNNHEEVVEGLEPHDRLKVLRIYFCGSSACPTWINKLEFMVELQLSDCKKIKKLPPLWQLPALQVLHLCRLDSLHCLCSGDTPFKFEELRELTLFELLNFQTWVDGTNEVHEEQLIFPRLEKLSICMCERLAAIPNPPDGNVWSSVFPVLRALESYDLGIPQIPMVGPLVCMVQDKASSYLLDQYKVMDGLEEQLKLLNLKLLVILDVTTNAEEDAANHREVAKAWLEAVQKVGYKANDVLDELKYEVLCRKAKEEGHYKELGMDVIKLFPAHNRVVFRYKMAKRLRVILQEIDELIAEMNAFRFKFKPQPPMPKQWRQTDSYIPSYSVKIASKSRAKEKKDLVDKLFARASSVDLTVLPIIGMGGLGKTTLAQLVYNDPEIQMHFMLRLWVCVSDDFDVDSLADKIVKENGCATYGSSALDRLQNAVSGKRYLLVLDDVWNHDGDKWEKLKSYLQHGGSGSSVLITTRDEAVAKLMMGTTEGSYKLGSLGADFIEEIIKIRAFSSKKEEEWPVEIVNMIGDVAKRCFGSPLAATALGSLLGTKTTEDEWKAVLSRSSIHVWETTILPVLKLSYDSLPLYMRQCFAFCAMFPKGYVIDVEMLIQLWMANGFITEKLGAPPEIIGRNIFVELAARSFFQDVKGTPFQFNHVQVSRITCKIHEHMYDLAQSNMGKECAAIITRRSETEDILNTRHLYLSVHQPEIFMNASLKKGSLALQTLICDGFVKEDMKILPKYNSIRALKTSQGSFLRPKYLHHLRYLDLSRSDIKALPEDISILYLLQTLNLSYCYNLKNLPKQLKYLTALRHLYTHGCRKLKSMPPELGHLTSLQTLTCFVAGTDSGCSNVGELHNLDLGGKLELSQLENVTGEDAQACCLGEKKKLTELELRWTDCDKEAQNNNHEEVVEGLKPHDGLKVLRIYFCWSSVCPTWINTLRGMVELQLSDCKKLEKLPSLWQLPALQVLQLCRLDSLYCLCSGDTTFQFQELKELTLSELPNFQTWVDGTNEVHEEHMIFPRLEKLSICMCERLTALPNTLDGNVWRSVFPVLREESNDLQIYQKHIAEVMPTIVVRPLVTMVKEKASSNLLDQYKVMEGMEEQHKLLKRKLLAILDVITDAEEQAAANRGGVKAWLEVVRTVAYRVNDVLDEFRNEALRRQSKEEGNCKMLSLDVIKLLPTHNRIVFRYRMANKLRMLLQEIDVLIAEMNAFSFKFKPQLPFCQCP